MNCFSSFFVSTCLIVTIIKKKFGAKLQLFFLFILFCSELFQLEGADDGQMVADATLVEGAEVGAIGFHVAVSGVGLSEEGECEDAGLLMGEGSGVGEQMVDG